MKKTSCDYCSKDAIHFYELEGSFTARCATHGFGTQPQDKARKIYNLHNMDEKEYLAKKIMDI